MIRASATYNLEVCYPEIVKEWHPTKNVLDPSSITSGSKKKIWWLCSQSHSYLASVGSRTGMNSGCPYCSGRKILPNKSIFVKHPELMKEWDFTENRIDPLQVGAGSDIPINWICSNLHKWVAAPSQRIGQKSRCPYCQHRRLNYQNSLAYKFPELCKLWDSETNSQSPSETFSHSHYLANWKCSKEHRWKNVVQNQIKSPSCKYCTHKLPSKEYNLEKLFPELMKEWDYKNNEIAPSSVLPYSQIKANWICKKHHKWTATIYNRTSNNAGCPQCCWNHTNLEKFVEEKLGIEKYGKAILGYYPDFKLSDTVFLNTDGLYFHSNIFKDKKDHLKLQQTFSRKGYQILQFYEDEIYTKWDIIENIINIKLGKIKTRIGARKCVIKTISTEAAKEFCTKNHLMGYCPFTKSIGLFYKDELISLLSYKPKRKYIEISRFCTSLNTIVSGAFSKLLKWIRDRFPTDIIISFCDLRYGNGNLYNKAGFSLEKITLGWCWGNNKVQRFHRLQAQNSEAIRNKWFKIYDAGQAKFVLNP